MKRQVGIFLVMIILIGLSGCGKKDNVSDAVNAKVAGYVFSYNDVDVVMDNVAEDVIKGLGKDYKYFEAASCAFEGLDKSYKYGDAFTVGTYPKDGKDYISYVYLMNNTVSTKEGLKVGDSIENMKKIYGDAKADETGGYSYSKGNMSLNVITADGITIDEIDYVSNVTKSTNTTK